MTVERHSWGYEDRLYSLRQIAAESRSKDPAAAVAAIAEYNRMMEAAARNPLLLSSEPAVADDKPMAKVFSPATLASRWGCSERHIRRLIQDEELVSFRAGTLIRIKASDVLEHEFKMQRLNEATSPNEIITSASEDEPRKRKKRAARLDTPALRARWKREREGG